MLSESRFRYDLHRGSVHGTYENSRGLPRPGWKPTLQEGAKDRFLLTRLLGRLASPSRWREAVMHSSCPCQGFECVQTAQHACCAGRNSTVRVPKASIHGRAARTVYVHTEDTPAGRALDRARSGTECYLVPAFFASAGRWVLMYVHFPLFCCPNTPCLIFPSHPQPRTSSPIAPIR